MHTLRVEGIPLKRRTMRERERGEREERGTAEHVNGERCMVRPTREAEINLTWVCGTVSQLWLLFLCADSECGQVTQELQLEVDSRFICDTTLDSRVHVVHAWAYQRSRVPVIRPTEILWSGNVEKQWKDEVLGRQGQRQRQLQLTLHFEHLIKRNQVKLLPGSHHLSHSTPEQRVEAVAGCRWLPLRQIWKFVGHSLFVAH